jgi:hypothetical protein
MIMIIPASELCVLQISDKLVVTRRKFYELAGLKCIHYNKASETWKNTPVAAHNQKIAGSCCGL